MANTLSFVTANFIARQSGYHLAGGWDEGQRTTEAYFRPARTFEPRFDELLAEIRALGFDGVDIWTGHLSPAWATPAHVAAARRGLARQGLRLVSLAGYFGATLAEFEAACRLAAELEAPLLGGVAPVLSRYRAEVIALLGAYDVALAIENHQQTSAHALLADIGEPAGAAGVTIGACVDTGSFATRGCDAAAAIATLGERVIHVHFRDVVPDGSDESVAFGQGCVPLQDCLTALRRFNYAGAISVEHEPEQHDPRADCARSLAQLQQWLR